LLASSLIALSLFAAPASATSFTTDQSDLWYIPSESGWGIQLVQRGNLIFFTMFVYDLAAKPIWYVGTISPTGAPFTWSGAMYVTSGPWLGAQPYNASLFGGRAVGALTWTAATVTAGTLSYTVDGVAVTKSIVRQTLVNDDFSGHYSGSIHEHFANCVNPANPINNLIVDAPVIFDISQSGNAIAIAITTPPSGGVCTYAGIFSQDGQMGEISNGTWHCNNGSFGSFTAFEAQINITGFTGRFNDNLTAAGCTGSGWFGGVRSTTF